jgi:hypothetical protein
VATVRVSDFVLLAVALLCVVAFLRNYVAAVLAEDRALARASVAGAAVTVVAGRVVFVRMLV